MIEHSFYKIIPERRVTQICIRKETEQAAGVLFSKLTKMI